MKPVNILLNNFRSLTFFCHLCLSLLIGLFPSGFHTKIQCVYKVPPGFEDSMVLKQIELDACTLLWLIVTLSKFLTYHITPQCGHPWSRGQCPVNIQALAMFWGACQHE
jgi:hypothetical protein